MSKKEAQGRANNTTPADTMAKGKVSGDIARFVVFKSVPLNRFGSGALLLLLCVFSMSAQVPGPAVATGNHPIRVVIENKAQTGAGTWVEFLRIAVPGVIGAGSAILAAFLTNRYNRKRQAESHQHERQLLELNLRNQEAKEINEWFLTVYTTDAIEPLETALLWLHEIFIWGSNESVPDELREKCYTCLARIATVIDTYAFFRFFNFLFASTVVLMQTRRTSPDVYATIGMPIRQQVSNGYVEASRYLNQLQEAMRFTIINHRSEVYKLAQTDRFRAFKERAESLSNSLDMSGVGQMLAEIERLKKPRQ